MSVQNPGIGWFPAVGVHASRLLKRWVRNPASLMSSLAMPILMIVILNVMFGGMIEQFSGAAMDQTAVCVMIAVAMSFTGALLGAGSTVQERHDGLPDRLVTLPGSSSTAMIGRILAESVKAYVSMLVAIGVGLAYGADFGSVFGLVGTLAVLAPVALSAGCVGVMLGFLVDTPQGAVSLSPIVMAAMFFNTSMMPREMYAKALRPIVDISPITAVEELVTACIGGGVDGGDVALFALWFGGLIVLSVTVLARTLRGPHH